MHTEKNIYLQNVFINLMLLNDFEKKSKLNKDHRIHVVLKIYKDSKSIPSWHPSPGGEGADLTNSMQESSKWGSSDGIGIGKHWGLNQ